MKKAKVPGSPIRVTVDIVIFTIREGALQVLLVRRGIPPFEGRWAIPGGFVLERESLEEAARRELLEETGVRNAYLEQLYTFGDVGRDPRARVVTVAYFALMDWAAATVAAGSDAAEAAWFPVARLPQLAFDHARILARGVERLRSKLDWTHVGFELMPREFTLSDLQKVHEAILGRSLDKRNFRRRVVERGLVAALQKWRRDGRRPARLFRFAPVER